MNVYEKSLTILEKLFAKDYQFALATSNDNIPSVRFVDTYYDNGAFYIVSYGKSQKVREIEENSSISMCNKLYRFSGNAYNIGHPLLEENREIRGKLMIAFEPWYLKHNNENDDNMCFIKIELKQGFFYKDGVGYKVDFVIKKAEEFPFAFDIVMID